MSQIKRTNVLPELIQIRADVIVNINSIDCIIKTNKDSGGTIHKDKIFYKVCMVKGGRSTYDYVLVQESDYNKYLKKYFNLKTK